nr:PREDICTED: uncharacterized protein LOC108221391 [Daucus carota subsp. sativus]
MGYADSQLTPSDIPIYGFNNAETKIEGMIQVPVTMGTEPRQATCILNFLVVKASSTYNAILGRTGIHAFKEISSTYHLKIKFPTRNGVGEEVGDQKMARSCYVGALKSGGARGQVLPIEDLDVREEEEERRGKPAEDLVPIPLYTEEPEKVTYVGALLQEELKNKLVKFLRNNRDVFAWTAADMPEWLANPVMVKKSNEKWRMCVDFTDLNDAYPKDCFPLPRIDTLIDVTAVMAFGLKNAGATYQRLANKMFKHL